MFATGVKAELTARHFLPNESGPESSPHSHPYEVEWICTSAGLDASGYAVDISMMERVLTEVLGAIDNVLLNDLPYFSTRQPSLENLATYLHQGLGESARAAGASFATMEIKIWESPTAWASYRE
ncbi:MAG: 6-carboxytetrahydropterin synthase [Spirochaetaceae bacterium]|nr:MAG: 6-carboxytetrahydropterin synthase [Spirochaetaceae bacterium]